jgi:hypothetical protein
MASGSPIFGPPLDHVRSPEPWCDRRRGEGEARLRADLRDPLLGDVEVVGNVDRSQLFHGGR